MNMEKHIQRFKMELLRKMPFYGDILMQISFQPRESIGTAATDGKTIWYNPKFLETLLEGERNFVLMHELFHVILRHGIRSVGKNLDRDVWNIACDIIVNNMLLKLRNNMHMSDIAFQRPNMGIFATVSDSETAENLYSKIMADNRKIKIGAKKGIVNIRDGYINEGKNDAETHPVKIPKDIEVADITLDEAELNDKLIQEIVRSSGEKNRSAFGSIFIPEEIYSLTESRKLDWRKLLKDFLSEEIGDDASYTTPERKYLHMDMILPGHSLTAEKIEEVWAFVDSSGSISHDEMAQFLTQIYRISREFKCVFNICYWDTAVTDVYKKVLREKDIFDCLPKHSGGTDINCVYDWIYEKKVKPGVMLVLTDGYFGSLDTSNFNRKLGKNTILVLSSDIPINADMKRIGKVARL